MSKYWAPLSGLLILALVNWAIYEKEQHLAGGRLVFLELAPVDPRSLMQGDYMALRFAMGDEIQRALRQESDAGTRLRARDGHVIVHVDQDRVAHFRRLDRNNAALSADELRLHYRVRNGRVKFATNAFFFQEGHAERYVPARYGAFRVNAEGEPLLVTMYDDDLYALGEEEQR